MNIVILAAGQGKRMFSALPKVLHPLAGKPMLAHVINAARSLRPQRMVVVFGHGGEAVRERITDADVLWVKQEPQLGTGHAVLQALPQLDEAQPTLVLYGDVPLIRAATLQRLLDTAGDDCLALLTVHLPDPQGYGRIVRSQGAITRIVEEKDATPAERALTETNTGILAAPTRRLQAWLPKLANRNAQGEYYLTDIVALAAAAGLTIHAEQPDAAWEVQGINSRVQLAELERIHQRNQALALLEQGVGVSDPARFDLRGELHCGRDVRIDIGCVFEGRVDIEDGAIIGPHCVIKDATIGANARIHAFSHIEGATVGAQALIGPYARLRPGTTIHRAAHVGNFVEIKNSVIGAESKANHLAYVGDADVGERVNIGAGSITCNYDGANKHRTTIEDDAFIGSDTQLVAPVTVGRGATLGAGTTLTRNAPPGQLTVTRAKQVSLPGWQRPVKGGRK